MPDLPLFEAEAEKALRIFNRLRLPDVIGQPTMAEAGTEWLHPIVSALFGSYDERTHRRMVAGAVPPGAQEELEEFGAPRRSWSWP